MSTQVAKITYLDGIRLYRAIVAGIRQVISQQEYLNNINVFPVPDRDTGTNMALTLNSVLESTYSHHSVNIHDLLDNVANAALNGARGNSGAILAQFFQGLSEGAQTVNQKMTTKNFVAAVSTAVNYAHKALSEPKEGTILTILRDFSDEITRQQLENNQLDFVALFTHGIERAKKSLEKTAFQLKEMKKAGVVDAGAQGFVEFLNGIHAFILNGSIKQLEEEINDIEIKETTDEIYHEIDERFRYCTECLINKKNNEDINHDELRNILDELGNSLIIAGSSKKTKVHIHANDPKKIFDVCKQFGDITGEKADDMIQQQKSFAHRETNVAILTDSSADLPEELASQFNIHVVPIIITLGSDTFIDKVSITSEEFHQLIQTHKAHPTTSQPSFGDFHRQYQYLGAHYDSIIALHIPHKLSGTLTASKKAADKVSDKTDVTVMDIKNAGAGQGLIVLRAAEAAKMGFTKEEIISVVEDAINNTSFYFVLTDLDFIARSGRLSEKMIKVFKFLKLSPVLHFTTDGTLKLFSMLFGKNKLTEKIFKLTKQKIEPDIRYRIIISYTGSKTKALNLKELIQAQFNDQIEQLFVLPLGATLTAHGGLNALGLAIQPITPLVEKEHHAAT